MFYFKKLTALLCIFLLGIPPTQADQQINTKFPAPGKMCFPQTSLRAELNKFNSVMLDHYLIISKEDHFKEGLVFVGFRLKSQPDALWLFDGSSWAKYNNPDSLGIFLPNAYTTLPNGQLQPIIPTFISNYPIDVSAYTGDGELWVGYGLAPSEAHTNQEIFDEMMSSKRFNLIWEIGNPKVATVGDLGVPNTICLSIAEMTEIIHVITTQ